MAEHQNESGKISISVGGSVSGQFGVGRNIKQTQVHAPAEPVSEAELDKLRQAINELKRQVAQQESPDKQALAVQHLDELHEAITAKKPELSTMENVRNWFVKNIPTMAGAVTAVVVDPIVGRLVQTGGDALVADFNHRFGEVQ